MKRLRHMWRNTKLGLVQTILVTIIVLGFTVIPPFVFGAEYLLMTAGGLVGLLLPYFCRDFLVDSDAARVVLRYSGFAIVIALVVLRAEVKSAAPTVQAGLLAILALYISSYFWVMSDERIIVKR